MRGIGLMIAGLPARLRVIRRTLTKLPLLAKTERAAITKGHQGELPSLTGLLCMRYQFTPNGSLHRVAPYRLLLSEFNSVTSLLKIATGLIFRSHNLKILVKT